MHDLAASGPHLVTLDALSADAQHVNLFVTNSLSKAQLHLASVHESVRLSISCPDALISYADKHLATDDLVLTQGCVNARSGYDLRFRSGDETIDSACGVRRTVQIQRDGPGFFKQSFASINACGRNASLGERS